MSGVLEVEDGGVSIDCVLALLWAVLVLFVVLTFAGPFEAELLVLLVIELDSRIVVKLTGSEGLVDGAAVRFLPLRVFVSVEWDLGWLVRFWFFFFFVFFK